MMNSEERKFILPALLILAEIGVLYLIHKRYSFLDGEEK